MSYILYEGGIGNDVFINNTNVPVGGPGFNGNDYLVGGGGNDVLIAGNGSNAVYGQGGERPDRTRDVFGAPMPNVASGGAGNDTITGATGTTRSWAIPATTQ